MKLASFIWAHLPDRGRFSVGVVLTFFEGLLAAVPALACGLALARLAAGGSTAYDMLPYGAAIIVSTGLRAMLVRTAWITVFEVGGEAADRIRHRIVDQMCAAPLGVVSRATPARLATLIVEDGRWITDAATITLNRLVSGAGTAAAIVLAIFALDWITGLALILTALAALALLPATARLMTAMLLRRNRQLTESAQRVGEYAEGIAVYRSYRQTGSAIATLRVAVDGLYDTVRSTLVSMTVLQQVTALALSCAVPLSIVATAFFHHGTSDGAVLPTLVPALFLTLAARNALASLLMQASVPLRLGALAQDAIGGFLAHAPLSGDGREPCGDFDVEVRDATVRHETGGPAALETVDLWLPPRGMVALVGPSGAGKSTLAALLLRNIEPETGRVLAGGIPLDDIAPEHWMSLVSHVGQDIHLFRDTVRANILIADPTASRDRLEQVVAAARLTEVIEALPRGLDTVIGEGGKTLSGGEKQRIAIARALLKDCPVLVLDEATSAIDPLNERAIQQGLATLEKGRTLLTIAHRLRTITDADEIVVLEEGRIVERGTHESLLRADGAYSRLWDTQVRSAGWRLP